jgi:DNA repair protein RecO (recombination protein O)
VALSRVYKGEAVVLHSLLIGEADLLVTLWAQTEGKLRAIAKGARKPSSRMVGHLEPLTRVDLALTRRHGLDVVTQAQVIESFQPLKSKLESLSQGFYVAELVNGFTAEGLPNAPLYTLLLDTLRLLPHTSKTQILMCYFELHLLKTSGFMPELYRCVVCSIRLTPGEHRFSPGAGGTLCVGCGPTEVGIMSLSLTTLKVLRFLDRCPITAVAELNVGKDLGKEIKWLLFRTVSHWLDREIRSKKFLEQVHTTSNIAV